MPLTTPRATPSDAVLVDRSLRGDPDAFAVLVERHRAVLLRVARPMVGHDAEDVVQQALLSAWLGLGRFDPARGTIVTWLCGITRNRAIDALRREGRRPRVTALEETLDLAAPDADPVEIVHRRVRAAAVRRALATLGPDQRTTLTLAYFGELSHREIHLRTAIPMGTVKGRVRLGLAAMGRELGVAV